MLAPVVLFLTLALEPTRVSSPILTKPAAIAKKENKVLFVHFTASWCGWCHRMERVLNSPEVKPYWQSRFVDVPVVVDEQGEKAKLMTPGGDALRKQLGGAGQGIPFFAFVKPDGTVIADSFMAPGKNIGCPATDEEISAFMEKLMKADRAILKRQFTTISRAFKTAK